MNNFYWTQKLCFKLLTYENIKFITLKIVFFKSIFVRINLLNLFSGWVRTKYVQNELAGKIIISMVIRFTPS